jgi:hypothetical protein
MSRLGFSSPDMAKQTTFRVDRLGLIHKSECFADLQKFFELLKLGDAKPSREVSVRILVPNTRAGV